MSSVNMYTWKDNDDRVTFCKSYMECYPLRKSEFSMVGYALFFDGSIIKGLDLEWGLERLRIELAICHEGLIYKFVSCLRVSHPKS